MGWMRGFQGVLLVAALAGTAFASGCATPDEDPFADYAWRAGEGGGIIIVPPPDPLEGTDDGGGGRTGGDWIMNGLSDPTISGVKVEYSLTSPQGLGSEGWLVEGDPDGEKVIKYLVECVLDEGDEITVTGASGTHTFLGGVGLAPAWKTSPCDETCQRSVSACLLARTNMNEVEVMIFIQGNHPNLWYGSDPEFPNYEGTFFGNVFADPAQMFACRGTSAGTSAAAQLGRDCTLSDTDCGFTTYADCDAAGCGTGPTGLPTTCQPVATGPAYPGISVHVRSP